MMDAYDSDLDDDMYSISSMGTATNDESDLDDWDDDDSYSTDDSLNGLDDDSDDDSDDGLWLFRGALAAGILNVSKKDLWVNRAGRSHTLDAGLRLLGDHVEHFTRFTAAEIKTLVKELKMKPRSKVEG